MCSQLHCSSTIVLQCDSIIAREAQKCVKPEPEEDKMRYVESLKEAFSNVDQVVEHFKSVAPVLDEFMDYFDSRGTNDSFNQL